MRWKVLYSCGSIQRRCTLYSIVHGDIHTFCIQLDLLICNTKRFGEWYNHFKDFGEVNNRQCFQKNVSENFKIETERFKHKAVDDQTKACPMISLSGQCNLAGRSLL